MPIPRNTSLCKKKETKVILNAKKKDELHHCKELGALPESRYNK